MLGLPFAGLHGHELFERAHQLQRARERPNLGAVRHADGAAETWLHSLIGLSGPVPIVSYVPLFMFAILFELSMDYEVVLVSQIEEHVHAGEDNRSSVVSGLVTSARVITAAALIMVFVFGSFVLSGDPTIKQFGVGLAVAVILDATVVRCLLVPATMLVMGKINWYFPGWLDRVVPRVSIEGAEYFAARDQLQQLPVVEPEPSAVGR